MHEHVHVHVQVSCGMCMCHVACACAWQVELEGIDTSNIIETSGRPRRAAAERPSLNGRQVNMCMCMRDAHPTTVAIAHSELTSSHTHFGVVLALRPAELR